MGEGVTANESLPYRIDPLSAHHDRAAFASGVEPLDRGKRLGELLLFDACSRVLRSEIATFALVVDAKDAAAEKFYSRYGFLELSAGSRRMFLPVTEIAALFT